MPGRHAALTLLVPLTLLLVPRPALAHRLEAECHVLPDRKVQVEAWFDLGGVPKGAQVQVFRAGGQVLTEGQLDRQGLFVFSYAEAEPLKVVVNAGAGHRKEVEVSAEELQQGSPGQPSPGTVADKPTPPVPLSDHTPKVSIKDVLIGVGFLLALAAFVLSLRNARQLRKLRQARQEPATPQSDTSPKRQRGEERSPR
jgi:nickel transport protein